MTRTLAHELGRGQNIRVNAVLPGAIATEKQKRLVYTPEYKAEILASQALKRDITPRGCGAAGAVSGGGRLERDYQPELCGGWRVGVEGSFQFSALSYQLLVICSATNARLEPDDRLARGD
jgi:NAD(P)-dependent dehydrogenase (short-subunit alcohol dehydrogenase family)